MLTLLTLYPVNLLQLVFSCVALFGVMLLWQDRRFRGLVHLLLYFAVLMLFNLLEETNISRGYLFITPAFTLLHGPLFYFFIRQLVNDTPLSGILLYCHFLPATIALPFTQYVEQIIVLATLSQLTYFYYSYRLLGRYRSSLLQLRSDAQSLTLNWVSYVLATITCLVLIDLIRLNIKTAAPLELRMLWYFVDLSIYFVCVSYLIIKAIRTPAFFDGMNDLTLLKAEMASKAEQQTAQSVFKNIEQIIVSDALYKQPRLTLSDVAQITGMAAKDVSWAINQGIEKNFCDYINGLRLEAFEAAISKELTLQASPQHSGKDKTAILAIALSCGFNSKSTFNALFKQKYQMTPGQFIKSRSG